MLLIWTNSLDGTTDILIDRLIDIPIFRFNIDLWGDYTWEISPNGFFLRSPTGRECNSADARLFYQRKPMFLEGIDIPSSGCLENWCREEILSQWRDVYLHFCHEGRAWLVTPSQLQLGKVRQLWLAAKFFSVPDWASFRGAPAPHPPQGPTVVKALTQTQIGADRVFFTKEVSPSALDDRFPWFLQSLVEATNDVTSVYVDGRIFSFELNRDCFDGVDCRQSIEIQDKWRPCQLSLEEESGIRRFMREAGLKFGRLDFLRGTDEKLYFLEVNPNGQWAWLDENGDHGLLDCICNSIREHYHAKQRSLIGQP